MKLFTTDEILISVTREELKQLNMIANSASIYYWDNLEKFKQLKIRDDVSNQALLKQYEIANTLWNKIYKIEKELPF